MMQYKPAMPSLISVNGQLCKHLQVLYQVNATTADGALGLHDLEWEQQKELWLACNRMVELLPALPPAVHDGSQSCCGNRNGLRLGEHCKAARLPRKSSTGWQEGQKAWSSA